MDRWIGIDCDTVLINVLRIVKTKNSKRVD